jgi:hypothetical protein
MHRAALAIVAGVLLMAGSARAQEFRGTISGTVTDPTGAVVPNATVQIREVHTGTTATTKSDSQGQYVAPFLLPGDYTVKITAPGFKTVTRGGIVVESQAHPIVDVPLPLGDSATTVEVTAAAPLLDQANASVGQVISTESVADLPLNGRTPTTLTELSVGVITTAAPQIVHPFDNNAGNSWSIGGTPNQTSEVLLDGSPDLTLLGALAYAPTQDSVQEVSIRPFDTDASFGHTIGGVVNQITKQGTNQLHGSIYEFSQVSALDSNLYFNDRNNKPKPVAHFNQYGLTVGGPVMIPKVYDGRNKMFFFFAYEGLKDSTPTTTTLTVPTAAERTGDFSALLAAGCSNGAYTVSPTTGVATCNSTGKEDTNQLYNPFGATLNSKGQVVRQALANNQVTAAGPLNSVALAYLKLYPQPNATSGVTATGLDNYISPAPSVDTYNNEFGRLDYSFGSRDHLFGDFRHNYRDQTKNDFFANGATGTTLVRENFGLTLDNVYTVNSSTIFDTRVNWTYFNEVHGTPATQYSAASVGLPASLDANSQNVQLPAIQFSNSTTVSSVGTNKTSFASLGDNTSAFDPTTSYQVFTDVVKVIGRHTLKMGFDGRQYRLSVQNFGNTEGSFNFGNQFFGTTNGTTGFAPTFGGDLASFLLGLPTAGQKDINARADYHSYYIGTFLQDDWRVNDRLTLNMGIRFDIDTPYREKFNRTVNGFNPAATNTASGAAAVFTPQTTNNNGVTATVASINALGGLTFPASGGAAYSNNSGFFSPRFGFSYSVDPKTVVRGGFGIFVQAETLASLNAQGSYSSNADNNQEGFSASTQYIAANSTSFQTPTAGFANPYPNGFSQPAGASAGASTFLGQGINFLAPYQHDPYSERWNIGVQRQLTNSTLFEAMYVGNHALHLPIASQNLNAVQLQYLTTNPYDNIGLGQDYGTTVTNPFAGLLPGTSYNSSTTKLSNLLGKYPQFGSSAVDIQNQTIGQSYFHSAIVHIEQRERHGLTLTANYSFSKLTEADTFLNDQDSAPTHRISPYDHTHHFTVGATYNLPFGKGKMFSFNGSRLMDEILGGFVINSIYQFQTGSPIEFSADIPLQPGVTLRDITNDHRNTTTTALNVADFVTGNNPTCPTGTTCDGSSFINGQYSFHYRTLPQTLSWVRQDGFNNMDASILKNFSLWREAKLQLRFETFNTFNHPIFAAPNVSSATASNFGQITSVEANSQPRQVQLGARITF